MDKTLENSKEFDDNHNERVSNNLNDGFVLRSTEYNENFDNIDDIDGEYDKISISMTVSIKTMYICIAQIIF